MKKFLLSLITLWLLALPAHAALDGDCDYVAGSTPLVTVFTSCDAEILEAQRRGIVATTSTNSSNDIIATRVNLGGATALRDGLTIAIDSPVTISGAPRINLDSTGLVAVVGLDGVALGSGDLVLNSRYYFSYKSSTAKWVAISPVGTGAASTTPSYLTVSNTALLPNERAATAGTFLGVTDNGANSTLVFNVTDAEVVALGNLTSAADKIPYFTGSGTAALGDLSSGFRTFMTTSSVANLGSVLTDEATGWATLQTTPSMANLGTFLTDDASGWTTFGTTPTSANLGALLTNELDSASKVLLFLGAPADDQVAVGDSATATTWRTLPTTSATQKLSYDATTNTFSAATDDDVPEAGDFGALSATAPITQSGGTISTSMTTGRLIGRTTASSGVMEEISAGSFLTLSGLSLNLGDVELTSIGGLTSAADKIPYYTGSGTAALADFSAALRTVITTPSSANFRLWVNDETGTGLAAFNDTPTLLTPVFTGLPTGTGVASAATASTLAARDSSANLTANNHITGYTTTATAAGTTTLTVASTQLQYFTGSTTQTVTLPVTSTLALGQSYNIVNSSSGAVTVNSSGGNLVVSVAAGTSATTTTILTSGTTAASWSTILGSGGGGGGGGTVTSVTCGTNLTGGTFTTTGTCNVDTSTVPLLASANTFSSTSGQTLNGPVIFSGASSGTVRFPATQNASAGANDLDDYEEGTWTPGFTANGSSASVTYTSGNTSGRYIKVGRKVTVQGRLVLTNNGSGTGAAALTGLPFTLDTGNVGDYPTSGPMLVNTGASSASGLFLVGLGGTTTAGFYLPGATNTSAATDTNITNTFDGNFSLTYMANN